MTQSLTERVTTAVRYARSQGILIDTIYVRHGLGQHLHTGKGERARMILGAQIFERHWQHPSTLEWELLTKRPWTDSTGESRTYMSALDIPEFAAEAQEQAQLEANPLYGMF